MTLFQLQRYIQYRRKALGRHGLHSPFAYAFVEDVLRNTSSKKDLLHNISAYYSITSCFQYGTGGLVPTESPAREKKFLKKSAFSFERLLLFPGGSLAAAGDYIATASTGDLIIVELPHANAAAEEGWNSLAAKPEVKLSIDVFHYGLLFFRPEFKVKQAFILK